MKRSRMIFLACILCLAMVFGLSACTENGGNEKNLVLPLKSWVDLDNLENCTLAVSFEEGAVTRDDEGKLQIDVTVYDYDLYDMVDVANLAVGKRIMRAGEEVAITAVERDESGRVILNGGLDKGGFELSTDDNTIFYELGYNDAKNHYEVGKVTLPLSEEFVFTDAMDPNGEPVEYDAEIFMEEGSLPYFFTPHNTSVVVTDGCVSAMNRRYVP